MDEAARERKAKEAKPAGKQASTRTRKVAVRKRETVTGMQRDGDAKISRESNSVPK